MQFDAERTDVTLRNLAIRERLPRGDGPGHLDIELAADRGVTIDAAMTGRSGSAVSPDDILDAPSPWASVGTSTGEPGFAVLGIARWMRRSETEPRGGDRLDVNSSGPLLRIEPTRAPCDCGYPRGPAGAEALE